MARQQSDRLDKIPRLYRQNSTLDYVPENEYLLHIRGVRCSYQNHEDADVVKQNQQIRRNFHEFHQVIGV